MDLIYFLNSIKQKNMLKDGFRSKFDRIAQIEDPKKRMFGEEV